MHVVCVWSNFELIHISLIFSFTTIYKQTLYIFTGCELNFDSISYKKQWDCFGIATYIQLSEYPLLALSPLTLHNSTALLTIGQEELNKLIIATTSLLDPIPTKLLKEVLPVVEEPLLNIISFYF